MRGKRKDNYNEENLVKDIKRDKQKFSIIYEKYYPVILNYLKKRLRNKELCEDLASEIFEKAYNSISDFKWQGVSLSSWLFRIAKNLLTDFYRQKYKFGSNYSLDAIENSIEDIEISLFADFVKDEEEIALYNALREFNELDQYLIYHRFFEGLSNKEIAELTSLAESNVGTRLYRIRKKLRLILKKEGIFLC